MPALSDIEKILNPADPSLTGLIPTVTTIAKGIINNNAVGDATNALTTGTQQGIDTVSAAGGKVSQAFQPYADAGQGALNQLSAGIAPGGGLTDPFKYNQKDFESDPAYQFDLQQANKNAYAQAGARGLELSGGAIRDVANYSTGLADKYYGQDYARAENTFNQNKAQRLAALQQATNTGMQATQGQVQGQEWSATQISDLLGQRADALAAGDVGKANSITQTLSGIAGQVSGNSALKKIYDVFKGGDSTYGSDAEALSKVAWPGVAAAGTAATGATGGLAGIGTIAEGIGTPSIIGATGTAAAEAAPATTAGAAGGGGLGGAAIGFLTNPITIGVGAAILGITALLKSQAHWEANTLIKDVQNPFGEKLGGIVNGFDQALASGQLDRATAQQMRDQTAAAINDFNNKIYEFAQGGSDEKRVALQALQTMADNFGARADYPNLPSYDLILGKMDQEIQGLPA